MAGGRSYRLVLDRLTEVVGRKRYPQHCVAGAVGPMTQHPLSETIGAI